MDNTLTVTIRDAIYEYCHSQIDHIDYRFINKLLKIVKTLLISVTQWTKCHDHMPKIGFHYKLQILLL